MSNLVIGVGGTGRGTVTWIDYYLRQDYSALANNFHLFVIDGPDEDPSYTIVDPSNPPNYKSGYNKSGKPNNFYQLSSNPMYEINNIKDKKHHKYISNWLHPEQAQNIKAEYCNPKEGGFGQSRVPAKACFYLEADKISTQLNALFTNAALNIDRVILVGSLIGGTGAGMLNNIASLIRQEIRNIGNAEGRDIQFIGITTLSQGYRQVFQGVESTRNANARVFAGLREIIRQTNYKGYPEEITDNLTIQILNKIYDVSFLISGNNHTDMGVSPLEGICCSAANSILVMGSGKIDDNIIAWINAPGTGSRVFRSFGFHNYVYSPKYTSQLMSYLFVLNFYNSIVNADAEEAGDRIKRVFESSEFTKAVYNYAERGKELPLSPPIKGSRDEFHNLLNLFLVIPGTGFSLTQITKIGKIPNQPQGGFIRNLFEKGLSNKALLNKCESLLYEIFTPNNNNSINKSLDAITKEILDRFKKSLWDVMEKIFINEQTGKPWTIAQKKEALKEAVLVISGINDIVDRFEKYFIKQYEDSLKIDIQNNLDAANLEYQKYKIQLENLDVAGYDYTAQNSYKFAAEQYAFIKAWTIVIDKIKAVSKPLAEITTYYYSLFAKPGVGWLDYMHVMKKQAEEQFDGLLEKLIHFKDNLPFTRYIPRPYDIVLQEMFTDNVENQLNEFMNQCSWFLGEVTHGNPDFKLIVPEDDREGIPAAYFNMFTGEYHKGKESRHYWADVFNYCYKSILPTFENMNIWDAFGYDYLKWREKHVKTPQFQDYANKKMKHSQERSVSLLPSKNVTLNAMQMICPNPGTTKNGQQIYQAFKNWNGANQVLTDVLFNYSLNLFCFNEGLNYSLEDWSYYNNCLNDYWWYNDQVNPDTPIHICCEEYNAHKIERRLKEIDFNRGNKILSPSVVVHLRDLDAFRLFWLTYLSGIFEQKFIEKSNQAHVPDKIVVPVVRGGVNTTVELGYICSYSDMLYNFLSPQNKDVREAAAVEWDKKLKLMNSPKEEISALTGNYGEHKNTIELKPLRGAGITDNIDRNDLIDAAWGSIRLYLDNMI